MKISKSKFVILFLASGFLFQFISNSILGPEVRLFPINDDPFPGVGSPIVWKNTISIILLPVKIVLIGPLSPLFELPDPPPPLLVLAFTVYWTAMALVIYNFLGKIKASK